MATDPAFGPVPNRAPASLPTGSALFASPIPGAAPQVAPIRWYDCTVAELRRETARAVSIRLRLADPMRHLAGQHIVVRLTAPDGYRAQRAYSIASPPGAGGDGSHEIEITVERLEGGEVSAFLHDGLQVGDPLTIRGPIGGWFAWRAQSPALLIGGGSGVVPLMAMLRLARRERRSQLVSMLVSVRSAEELFYAEELRGPEVMVAFTRRTPDGGGRPPGRLSAADLEALDVGAVRDSGGSAYVCGSAGFADSVTGLLEGAGFPVARIRVERFGAT
jgi:ferredoxin-NADP reductase